MATSYEAYILRLTDHREQETTEEVKVKGRETLDFNISIICMFSTLFYSQYLLIRILVMYPEYLVTLSAEKSFCPGAALPSFTSYSEEPCCGHHNRNIFTHKLYRRDNILELRTRCRLCYFRFCLYQRLRKLGAYSSDAGHSYTKCDRPRRLAYLGDR
jgi:hypothetical protein